MKKILISVIVTTKNESAMISACLQSILNQTYKHLEIIVVDNGSTDNTKQLAKEYTNKVHQKGPERSAQRNYGATKSSGDYVLFIDADMVLTPGVIAACVASRPKIGIIIPEKSFGIGFWAKCKALERACYENVVWIESARFFKKDIFMKVHGYDEALTGPEDFELPQRVKKLYGDGVFGRIDSYILHNEGELSLAKLLRKKYYYGMRMRQYSKHAESSGYFRRQSNIFLRYFLYLKRLDLFLADPIHYVGMFFMKTFEMGALALGGI